MYFWPLIEHLHLLLFKMIVNTCADLYSTSVALFIYASPCMYIYNTHIADFKKQILQLSCGQ